MNNLVCATPSEGKNAFVWVPTHKYLAVEVDEVSY